MVFPCGGGIAMQQVQIDIQDKAVEELGRILEAKNDAPIINARTSTILPKIFKLCINYPPLSFL